MRVTRFNPLWVSGDNQYGFRKNRSPSLALIDLCDKISSAFDRREHAIGVFLDLSKASDTVNHVILFDKLEHYGIRDLALEWVKRYFSERKQFVEFNNVRSSPQGNYIRNLYQSIPYRLDNVIKMKGHLTKY